MSTNGQLLIGGTSGPASATLTAGSNVTITNADGAITIAAAGGGGGSAVTLTAGDGLTGGGDTSADRTFTVVGGDGITANANDVAITAAQTTITSVYNLSLIQI